MYLSNKELYYQLVVSTNMGKLTPEASKMLELLAKRSFQKLKLKFYDSEERADSLQTAMMVVFANWYLFNEDKTSNAFAYITEICKRAFTSSYNVNYKRKGDPTGSVKVYSIDRSNEGEGMHNI